MTNEQPEENPNLGKQFDELMGRNFTRREENATEANAALGAAAEELGVKDFGIKPTGKIPSNIGTDDFKTYFKGFVLPDEIGIDEHGPHACYVTKRFVHKWRGGNVVEHYEHGPENELKYHAVDGGFIKQVTGPLKPAGLTSVEGREWDGDNALDGDSFLRAGYRFEKGMPEG
jgi:hypothetical protein